mmetsp:Transcript_122268/g.273027  ORF Transcript_122268/g.273027 Transcript_122268/m.273027 type:complete len:208 (-) Transcript_122268:485-1108(-)
MRAQNHVREHRHIRNAIVRTNWERPGCAAWLRCGGEGAAAPSQSSGCTRRRHFRSGVEEKWKRCAAIARLQQRPTFGSTRHLLARYPEVHSAVHGALLRLHKQLRALPGDRRGSPLLPKRRDLHGVGLALGTLRHAEAVKDTLVQAAAVLKQVPRKHHGPRQGHKLGHDGAAGCHLCEALRNTPRHACRWVVGVRVRCIHVALGTGH